jgi:hypothetical protein
MLLVVRDPKSVLRANVARLPAHTTTPGSFCRYEKENLIGRRPAQASNLFNVARAVLSVSLFKVLGHREFSLSGLNERIAPSLCAKLAFNLQQKTE